jgi:hypothetical protein
MRPRRSPVPTLLLLTTLLAALGASPLACAQTGNLDYTVAPRDTLIGLGQTLLVHPGAWPEVARLNRLPDANRITPGQVLKVPARLLRSRDVPATLQVVTGEVLIDALPAKAGDLLKPGQTLRSAANSSAVLVLGDGSRVQLAPASQAQLAEHRRYALKAGREVDGTEGEGVFASTMRLISGSVDLFATKVLRAKPLEVTTPTAVIGVRGTDYRVHFDEPGPATAAVTRAEVLTGRVRVDSQAAGGVEVAAGQGTALQGREAPQVVALLPAPDLSGVAQRFERPLVRFAVPGERDTLRVQVAADRDFNTLQRDELVPAGTEARLTGLADGQWFLRVRRVDPLGIAGLDAHSQFVLKARPEPPAGVSPRAAAKLSVGQVELAWAQNTQATSYRAQIARTPDFKAPDWQGDSLSGSNARLTLSEPGTYFWRLASVKADGDLGPWGDAQRFELKALPEPPQGGLKPDGGVELSWSGRPQDKQQVELARDASFTTLVAQAELNEARWALPRPDNAGSYFFRYRSVEPDGFTTPWSSTLTFEVPRDWRPLWLLVPLLFAL